MTVFFVAIYLFIAVLMIIYMSIFGFIKRMFEYKRYFAALGICACFYLLGYLMELISVDSLKFYWNQIQYLGLPFMSTLWLGIIIFYLGIGKKQHGYIRIIPFFIVPIIGFLGRLTNFLHNGFYVSSEIVSYGEYSLLTFEYGPLWHMLNAYNMLALLVVCAILVYSHIRYRMPDGPAFIWLTVASLMQLAGVLLSAFDLWHTGFDYNALLMPLTISIFAYVIYRFDFFELRETVRETVFIKNRYAMLMLDANGRVIDFNEAADRLVSATGKKLTNDSISYVLKDNTVLLGAFSKDDPMFFCLEGRSYEVQTERMPGRKGKLGGVLKTVIDITGQKRHEERLSYMATVDELSGLYNRRSFIERARMLIPPEGDQERLCMLMLDVDDFKNINDTYGHHTGDAVIRSLGRLIRMSFRSTDIIGRLGGEEFGVVLPGTILAQGIVIAEKFREKVENLLVESEDSQVNMTVSIGIAEYGSGQTFDDMIRASDKALYQSKAAGKNRVTAASAPSAPSALS